MMETGCSQVGVTNEAFDFRGNAHGEVLQLRRERTQIAKPHSNLGWHYLSNATCLMQPHVLYVVRRVEDNHTLLHSSPLLKRLLYYSTLWKNTCVRQVVLDKLLSPPN